jgi:putative ABC transport system permease protein
MNGTLLLRSILLRLKRYKLKTLFMGLGITISVLAMVMLQTVSGSVRETFTAFIERTFPANSVFVMAGTGMMGGSKGRSSLRLSEVETVVNTVGIKEWDPMINAGARDVKQGSNNERVNVTGHSEMAESVRGRSVQEGEFFSLDDIKNRANVALIGVTTAKKLFPGEPAVGARIFIDNIPFQVKGILESIGVDPHGGDQDDAIYLPYTTLMDNMLRVNFVGGVTFVLEDRQRADAASKEIAQILREQHQIGPGEQDDFSVVTPIFMHKMLDQMLGTFDVFVPIISATAFLISAAVILSIMQISIKSRTAEIGLRKAVGARHRDLQAQIIYEVLIVSVIAALIGLVLAKVGSAYLAPVLAAKYGVKRVSPRAMLVLFAVLAAVVTGLVGGILPARRAAKLNPVQALR